PFRASIFPHSYARHRALHSFPTRRSSDLCFHAHARTVRDGSPSEHALPGPRSTRRCGKLKKRGGSSTPLTARRGESAGRLRAQRSEEHTSELQSRENLVCRLLLEKKKILP